MTEGWVSGLLAQKSRNPLGFLSLRQNLRFCHLPRQREVLARAAFRLPRQMGAEEPPLLAPSDEGAVSEAD